MTPTPPAAREWYASRIAYLAWGIVLGWNGAAVALAFAAWRAGSHLAMRRALRALWVLAIVPLAAAPLGAALGYFRVRGAIDGEAIEPAQRARVLAETISEAMNLTALLVLIAFVPFSLAVAGSVLARRRRKREAAVG